VSTTWVRLFGPGYEKKSKNLGKHPYFKTAWTIGLGLEAGMERVLQQHILRRTLRIGKISNFRVTEGWIT
jgi:hypothetical protein